MNKYIIELDKNAKEVVVISLEDGDMRTETMEVEDLEQLNSDYINEHFGDLQDTAYQRGLEDGKEYGLDESDMREAVSYQRGLEDGKAVNDKGCEGCKYSGTPQGDSPCFNCSNYYQNNWTAKDDKIEVGDEVTAYNELIRKEEHFVVIEVGGYFGEGNVGLFALYGNDKSSVDFKAGCFSTSAKDVTKTGRHFDIASILEDMKA